jgi:hypothetical protein
MPEPSELRGDVPSAIEFLRLWAPKGMWVLSAIDPDSKDIQTQTFRVEQELEARAWIDWWQGKRNIYFSVNQPNRVLGIKAKKEDMALVVALHVDVDPAEGSDFTSERAAILARLREFVPRPSVIVDSGGGMQGFWLFAEPLDARDHKRLELYNIKLEQDLGGDHCHNIDRVMRLPGTINIPTAKKTKKGRVRALASVVEADWNLRYALSDFTPAIAKPEIEEEPEIQPKRKGTPPDWCQRLIEHGHDPLNEHNYDGDRSKAVFAVACALVRCAWARDDIVAVLLDQSNGISEHVRAQKFSERYARRQVKRAVEAVAVGPVSASDGRVIVRILPGEIHKAVTEAEAALVATQPGLYCHGSRIVRVVWEKIRVSNNSEGHTLRFSEINHAYMLGLLSSIVRFERWDARAGCFSACDCPKLVSENYLSRDGLWRLPTILGVVTCPTLRPDGTVIEKTGYDERTGILFDARGAVYPAIPLEPTREQALEAIGLLDKLIDTFPFVSKVGRAVALSGILTSVIRRSLPVAPLHAFSSPEAGTGKSMLVDLASIIATGERAAVTSTGRDKFGDAEMEKRLTASMLAGDTVLAIDNLEHPLGGAFLCQLLTQHKVKLRPLGRSVNVEVPNTTMFFATGNNLVINGDATRRAMVAGLDAGVERPELREFHSHPLELARSDRGRYVAASLTVIRAFLAAGSPRQSVALGSYEEWTSMVRDPLIWLGYSDPVESMEETRRNDPRRSALTQIIAAWIETVGVDKRVMVRELISLAGKLDPGGEHGEDEGFAHPNLREAMLTVARGERGEINTNRFAEWLKRNHGRVHLDETSGASYRIVQDGAHSAVAFWRLEKV